MLLNCPDHGQTIHPVESWKWIEEDWWYNYGSIAAQ